jgi:large subunit ribosomal protein L9
MDVVLLTDVERLGAQGQLVRVKDGYARNFLLPKRLAAEATPAALARLQAAQRLRERQAKRLQGEAEALKRRIEATSLTLKLSLGADERPFGSVSAHDIIGALQAEGLALEKHALRLEEPIKTLGIYEIPVRLPAELTATLKVWVVKA